jgi:hypothetical protein
MSRSATADRAVIPYALLSVWATPSVLTPLIMPPCTLGSFARSAEQSTRLRVMPQPLSITWWLCASIGMDRRSIQPVMTRSDPI